MALQVLSPGRHSGKKRCGNRQSGMALVLVLLSMALVVMMTAGMVRNQSVRVYKAGHYLAQTQGYSVALGTEAFAQHILVTDFENDRETNEWVDSPDEVWARYAAVLPLDDGGVAEIQIDDLTGRINLNDLVTPAGQINTVTRDRLTHLFMALDINDLRVDALIDWIDADEETVSAYGAEDGQYLLQEPSYRAANQPFVSVTELRLIEGMTEEYYQALRPHVAALPISNVGINVNMATAPVLRTLNINLTDAQAESVVQRRQEERFLTTRDFLAAPEFVAMGLKADGLRVNSLFFEVVSRITWDDRVVNLVSTVYRSPEGEVYVVSRDTGQKNRITKEPFGVIESE